MQGVTHIAANRLYSKKATKHGDETQSDIEKIQTAKEMVAKWRKIHGAEIQTHLR